MGLETKGDRVVHFPSNPDKFEFDAEVTSVFDDMATRSIPMYNEIHRMHLSMLSYKLTPGSVVLDVGASTGMLFRSVENMFGTTLAGMGVKGIAMDPSAAMLDRLRQDHPEVETVHGGIPAAKDLEEKADIIFCFYVLQFIEAHGEKSAAIDWLLRNLKDDGVLVMGQKDLVYTPVLDRLLTAEYHGFRRANGYTQEEINAKSKALANSMWPVTFTGLENALMYRGMSVQPTSRWLQFNTLIATRRG